MVLGPGERWAFVQPFEMKARAGRVWVEIQTQSGTNPEPLRAITVVR